MLTLAILVDRIDVVDRVRFLRSNVFRVDGSRQYKVQGLRWKVFLDSCLEVFGTFGKMFYFFEWSELMMPFVSRLNREVLRKNMQSCMCIYKCLHMFAHVCTIILIKITRGIILFCILGNNLPWHLRFILGAYFSKKSGMVRRKLKLLVLYYIYCY